MHDSGHFSQRAGAACGSLTIYLEMDVDDDQRASKPPILSLMMTARHSGTETNRVSTNCFIQRLEHLSCLQQGCSKFCNWACF